MDREWDEMYETARLLPRLQQMYLCRQRADWLQTCDRQFGEVYAAQYLEQFDTMHVSPFTVAPSNLPARELVMTMYHPLMLAPRGLATYLDAILAAVWLYRVYATSLETADDDAVERVWREHGALLTKLERLDDQLRKLKCDVVYLDDTYLI
jgi:hypothetical protein